MTDIPALVQAARSIASEAGFEYSSDDRVGVLLSALAAAVPRQGRILELGTGAGVGTAWFVHGLHDRTDVELVTVEADRDTAAIAQRQPWPQYVKFIVDDAVHALPSLGHFDLVFADAQGGKWDRLDLSIGALAIGGIILVDDMTPQDWWTDDHAAKQSEVRETLCAHPVLVSCELEWATGVILSTRRL